MKYFIKNFFEIEKNQSSLRQEITAGLTVFLSMAYIVSVHPQIISQTGMPFSASVTAVILVCFFSSLAMGIYANNPLVLGPGMSLSSFFTFTLVKGQGVPYEIALGAVFWTGVLFFILSFFKIREKLALAVPPSLKKALICGIGLFVAFVGLKEGGLIEHSGETFLKAQTLSAENIVFLIGLTLTFLLLVFKIKGALLISIPLVTFLSLPLGRLFGETKLVHYKGVFSLPDFSVFAQMDLWGSLQYSFWPVLFSIAFVDLFESLSSILSIAKSGPLLSADGSEPRHLKKTLQVDSASSIWAGLAGCSTPVCFLESLVGLRAGGKTGLTAVTTAVLFLPFLFLSPLLSMIPAIATAPILVVLGSYMMKPATGIEWDKPDEALPAFMIILLIPLCFSIIQGIIYGFLFYTILKIAIGKGKELSPYMYCLTGLCALFPLRGLFTQ